MVFKLPPGMIEATRLTREGRLTEATSLIQRMLRGASEARPKAKAGAPARRADVVDLVPEQTAAPARAAPQPTSSAQDKVRVAAERESKRGVLAKILGKTAEGAPAVAPKGESSKANEAPVQGRGTFLNAKYSNEAGSRAYKLYVPSSHNGSKLPLIIMLHGCTQSAEDFAAGTAMNAIGEEHGCIIAYPEQSNSANPSRCWNWFNPRDQKRDSGEPSIIAGITREIIGNYAIDTARVYVAGLSAGGAAAAIMGATYPDLFAAVGVHSGLPAGSAHDVGSAMAAMRSPKDPSGLPHAAVLHGRGRLVPTIVFHGDKDTTVHPNNGQHVISLSRTREWGELRAVSHPGRVQGGHAYTRTDHHDAAGRVVLEMWVVHGAGHAWSGGNGAGSYTDPKGPDASREMLRFFLKHPASRP
jgi:poly(hydroxyalkanoate) depolymerase family esterase